MMIITFLLLYKETKESCFDRNYIPYLSGCGWTCSWQCDIFSVTSRAFNVFVFLFFRCTSFWQNLIFPHHILLLQPFLDAQKENFLKRCSCVSEGVHVWNDDNFADLYHMIIRFLRLHTFITKLYSLNSYTYINFAI